MEQEIPRLDHPSNGAQLEIRRALNVPVEAFYVIRPSRAVTPAEGELLVWSLGGKTQKKRDINTLRASIPYGGSLVDCGGDAGTLRLLPTAVGYLATGMVKQKPNKSGKKPPEMPGADYGVDRPTAIMTAPDFNDNLRAANIIACAYGEMPNREVDSVLPVVSIVGTKADPLTKAFLQFKAWMDATGPDALRVEILYSGEGYYISFGPDYHHALWRTVGIDQLPNPMYWGFSYLKKIDTRNALLDRLARHSTHPVAPVIVSAALYAGPDHKSPSGPRPHDIQRIEGCPDLLLFNLPIYKTPGEVPKFSGLIAAARPNKEALSGSRDAYEKQIKSPSSVLRARERRLSALMPVTMHMLRSFAPLHDKIEALAQGEISRWQIEQAIVNQRLWSLLPSSRRARFQNAKDRYKALENFMEVDSPNWESLADDREAIMKQVLRDARALLKGLGAKPLPTLAECQDELRKLGHLTDPGTTA